MYQRLIETLLPEIQVSNYTKLWKEGKYDVNLLAQALNPQNLMEPTDASEVECFARTTSESTITCSSIDVVVELLVVLRLERRYWTKNW